MAEGPAEFLSPERARQLSELAEQARDELGRFSGQLADYDATGVQLLDEWIERVPSPPRALRVLWVAFLGEVFRRHHAAEWVIRREDGQWLALLCPRESGGIHQVEVAAQLTRRLDNGMADSLALFYARESVLLRKPRDL